MRFSAEILNFNPRTRVNAIIYLWTDITPCEIQVCHLLTCEPPPWRVKGLQQKPAHINGLKAH